MKVILGVHYFVIWVVGKLSFFWGGIALQSFFLHIILKRAPHLFIVGLPCYNPATLVERCSFCVFFHSITIIMSKSSMLFYVCSWMQLDEIIHCSHLQHSKERKIIQNRSLDYTMQIFYLIFICIQISYKALPTVVVVKGIIVTIVTMDLL